MVRICLKEYLEKLYAREVLKEKGPKRMVPSMNKLADLAGLHRGSLNRIANNHGKALNFETANAIIGAMNNLGFDMEISDLIIYDKSLSK